MKGTVRFSLPILPGLRIVFWFEALEKQVKIRETGRVTMSGSLKFLGRTIPREKGSSGLQLFV